MGSEAQDELELVKQELKKYKSLKLTSEQKEHLKRLVSYKLILKYCIILLDEFA